MTKHTGAPAPCRLPARRLFRPSRGLAPLLVVVVATDRAGGVS